MNGQASCNIDGPAAVCGGSTNQHTSTVLPAGGTVTHSWSISGDGTISGSTTGASVSVIAGASGSYTVTDNISRNGCLSSCQKTVTVNPNPTCSINGPAAVCAGSTNEHTSTVLPAGGTVTHSWSISGDGTISGSATGATVSVIAGTSGSYTVTDNNSRNGCLSSCQKTVSINENPTCSIAGTQTVCGGTTNNYTSTVLPAGGTVTHSWSISGNGTITGSATSATVAVIAGASGSYTVIDNITRNGCASTCRYTVTVNPCGDNCTYTQGYYGNKNGNSCDGINTYQNPRDLISYLLGITTNPVALNPLVVGRIAGNSVTIPANSAAVIKLNNSLPGGRTPTALRNIGNCNITDPCFDQYLRNGRINNNLLSQTIVLSLNARIRGGRLASYPVQNGWLATQKRLGCGLLASPASCTLNESAIMSWKMNEAVANYLTNFGNNTATVANLLDLANDVLGGILVPGTAGANGNIVPSYSNVNYAVDMFNNAFDGCRIGLGYFPCQQTCDNYGFPCAPVLGGTLEARSIVAEEAGANDTKASVKVSVFPNPFSDKVKFTIDPSVSGKATLKIYNTLGQLMTTLFQGEVPAGKSKIIPYNVPVGSKGNLFYIYEQNGQRITGTLIRL